MQASFAFAIHMAQLNVCPKRRVDNLNRQMRVLVVGTYNFGGQPQIFLDNTPQNAAIFNIKIRGIFSKGVCFQTRALFQKVCVF